MSDMMGVRVTGATASSGKIGRQYHAAHRILSNCQVPSCMSGKMKIKYIATYVVVQNR